MPRREVRRAEQIVAGSDRELKMRVVEIAGLGGDVVRSSEGIEEERRAAFRLFVGVGEIDARSSAEVLPQVIQLATEKVEKENGSRSDLMSGAYLRDVYDKYGVL